MKSDMRDSTDARIRRGLLVLAAVCLSLALAGPVVAKEEKMNFVPGPDISSWFWQRQVDEEVTTPEGVTIPPPVPPASQRVRLPNPQRPNTIPVALNQGQPERMSAVKFDLTAEDRGVTDGSKIKKLILYIEESIERNEHPQVNPESAKIQACRILEFLPQGENEQWKDAPKFDDKACVEGTRDAPAGGAAAVWTFDLTKIADVWGKSSYENNGVILAPVVEAGKTWQINLKVPRKEAPAEEGDQYELTKNMAFITIDFIPGEPADLTPPAATTDTTLPASTGTSSVPSSTGFSPSGSPIIGSSTDFGSEAIPGAEPPPAPAPTEIAGFAVPQEQGPRMPAYVWLAIPLGLLALSAIRSVILEPVGGPRPDGVIAAIRRRNAERRGGALGGERGFLARMTGGFKRGTGGVGKALSSATRSVRRKR